MTSASAALAALALAACSGKGSPGGGMATPVATISPGPSGSPGTSPVPASIGVAYLPDGGNGAGFTGLQIVHFEDTASQLLPSSPTSVPAVVTFSGAVGPFVIAGDGLSALAAVSTNGSPNYTRVQSVFGTSASATVPVGTGYDVTQLPTAAPNVTPNPGASATPVPSPLPVLSAVTSLALYGSGLSTVGVVAGPDTTGYLGLTQLQAAGPVFGGFVPFQGQTPAPALAARPHVVTATGTVSTALLRGPADLLAYTIAVGGTGYTFALGGQDATLGLSGAALGTGVMAIDPFDTSRALIGQTDPGDGSRTGVTLVTGLPGAITHTASVSVGSIPRSIAITSGGGFAVVGTDAGFVVVAGVASNSLKLLPAFAPSSGTSTLDSPSYVGCDGKTYALSDVTSVAFSADQQFLAALGNQPSAACAQGRTASLVVLPFNETTGTAPTAAPSPAASATAAPQVFVQNNVIAPSAGQDYAFVR